jgi:hypothetical protein
LAYQLSQQVTRLTQPHSHQARLSFNKPAKATNPRPWSRISFQNRPKGKKTKLANDFVKSAGKDGLNKLAQTPNGQYALAIVYDHSSGEHRQLMEEAHKEQGNTAVDYTDSQQANQPKRDASHAELLQRKTMLYEAMHDGVFGLGTNEKRLISALQGLSPSDFTELKHLYQDHYQRDLEADIKSELSGSDRRSSACHDTL